MPAASSWPPRTTSMCSSFTGSTSTGKAIMRTAADSVKKLSLELGGKSACLVFADADIAAVAPKLAAAATIISGQQCTAARRVLVHASKLAEMKTALAGALSSLKIGSGLDPATQVGPLIDICSRDKVAARIEEACAVADEVLLAEAVPGGNLAKGAFLAPSLVHHGDPNAFFCQEEIFGPFLVLESFETEAEAVAKANNSVFGLSASVWTHDVARAQRIARALRSGTVWINEHNKLLPEAETGGYRQSGLGPTARLRRARRLHRAEAHLPGAGRGEPGVSDARPLIVGISGASGVVYGIRVLEAAARYRASRRIW